jgi:hypothetical protein
LTSESAGITTRATLPKYVTYDVRYEHLTESSDTVRQDRAIITVYGGGELAIKQAIERQRPGHKSIIIIEVHPTSVR